MFLVKSKLRTLIKEAFKKGVLQVAAFEDCELVVAGGYWIAAFPIQVPKEVKAAVLELAGEFPEIGQSFTADKYGNQYEMACDFLDLPARMEAFEHKFFETSIVYREETGNVRIYQAPTLEVLCINDKAAQIVDEESIDYDAGELPVSGPHSNRELNSLFWQTNLCMFQVIKADIKKDQNFFNMLYRTELETR